MNTPAWVNRPSIFWNRRLIACFFTINSNLWLIGLKNDENCLLSSSLDLCTRILIWISITHLVSQLIIAHGSCWIYSICSSFIYTPKQHTLEMCVLQLRLFTKGVELSLSTDDHFSAIFLPLFLDITIKEALLTIPSSISTSVQFNSCRTTEFFF